MRRTDLAPWLARVATVAALLLAAAPLAAYTIYLKDGSSIQAREKYTVQGANAAIILPSGARSSLPLAQIDVARTQSENVGDFGSATVLRGPATAPPPAPTPRRATLGELASQGRALPAPPRRPETAPAPAHAAAAAEGSSALARTPAGSVDFLRAPRAQVSRLPLATTVGELLRARGVSAGIFEGTQPRRLLLEVTANSEGAVFQAIAGAAQAMLDLEAKQPRAIEALELFVATDHRARAGQFLITPERARELVSKQLDLTAFYLKYVEF